MGWTYGQNERGEITEKIRDKETMRLQKTRKITAKMGGLSEERDLRKALMYDRRQLPVHQRSTPAELDKVVSPQANNGQC